MKATAGGLRRLIMIDDDKSRMISYADIKIVKKAQRGDLLGVSTIVAKITLNTTHL